MRCKAMQNGCLRTTRWTTRCVLLMVLTLPALATGIHKRRFVKDCDEVWKASVEVSKSSKYQIVGISKEERVLSVDVGGFYWGGSASTELGGGQRTVTLTLEPAEHGCVATVRSH